MRKLLLASMSLLTILTLLAACGPKPTEPPAPTKAPTEAATEPPAEKFQAGMVTDVGGIDDKSFNATSWNGMDMAEKGLGVEVAYLESQQQTDYAPNITQFIDQDYDMIVTVGFLLGEDTATFAKQNPDTYFAIVDYAYDPAIDNVLGLTFATDEAAFVAGYLAAGMTKTGKVGTFGGIEIPPVTIFMVGFENGVTYYNEEHGTNVTVLGTDLYVGNFESTDDGRRAGEDLIAEGADIIMPVAGPVGLGTAAAIQDNPGTMLIGVDTDWCVSAPEYCDVTLTSVMKNMDAAVLEAITRAKEGTFEGGTYVGTLDNGGVGVADFHEFDDDVPADLDAELDDVRQALIDGTIDTGWPPGEAPEAAEEPFQAGMVTDVGGIDDKSFNATSWNGMDMAEKELGVEVAYLESQQQTDYAPNITQFIDQDYDMIVTVGFLLGEDTATFAKQNPDTNFAIVDYAYDPAIDNVLGLTFATDEAAFVAGYLAAGMTKTGKVGTFGGIEIPPVTIFMVGFENGVNYYNEEHGTDVTVLGTDLYVGNFESTDDGRRAGEDLIAEGADIIMPVAGPVGLGTAAAIQDNPGTMLIGVDTDWCVSAAEYCDVTLTSVMKNMDAAVLEAITRAKEGTFEGGTYVGTLDNGGVGIADFHEFDDDVPADLKAELDDLRQALIDGTIDTGW